MSVHRLRQTAALHFSPKTANRSFVLMIMVIPQAFYGELKPVNRVVRCVHLSSVTPWSFCHGWKALQTLWV
ncbi:unnamed protein product [Gadus morhua 'NCC']